MALDAGNARKTVRSKDDGPGHLLGFIVEANASRGDAPTIFFVSQAVGGSQMSLTDRRTAAGEKT